MEEQKIDKRTKEYREMKQAEIGDSTASSNIDRDYFDQLRDSAVLMRKVILQDVVESWTMDPERAFYDPKEKAKKSRTGKIYYTTSTVLIEQDKGHKIILPTTMVKYALPL